MGHEAVVKLLLETNRVEVDAEDYHGQTPLSHAAGIGHEAIVKLLLGFGRAELDWKNSKGRQALSMAIANKREAVVNLLIELDKTVLNEDEVMAMVGTDWNVDVTTPYGAEIKRLVELAGKDPDFHRIGRNYSDEFDDDRDFDTTWLTFISLL
jgi:hypothetical protein